MTAVPVALVINRQSGTGHDSDQVARILAALARGFRGRLEIQVANVCDHAAARLGARGLMAATAPRAVVVCGGGGTLRAVLEGVREVAGDIRSQPPIGCLRMGSGNVVARALGVPQDPVVGAMAIGAALRRGAVVEVPTLEVSTAGARAMTGVAMCGLGQWGSVPGDILMWRAACPGLRRRLASLAGIEAVNHVEYAAAGARRLAWGVEPGVAARAAVSGAGIEWEGRLLALSVANVRVAGVPGADLDEARARVALLPASGRPVFGWLTAGDPITVRYEGGQGRQFFLDEDPETARGEVRIALRPGCTFITCKEVQS